MPTGRQTRIRRLVDNSGGVPSPTGTVAPVPASYSQATLAAIISTLVAKLNELVEVEARRPG
jgi:hypothetical protein